MWFGNLVTMRWWDDLWLNESFATYISYLAMTEATRFTNAWKVFNADIKRWAYQQDQLPTTHPIAGSAADTEIAFLNFDGITYGKGASVLKQLVKYIGRDAFRDGLRIYFKRYGWSNATLDEFLGALEESSGRSLTDWARLWLRTASVNTLSTEWETSGDRLSALAIRQTAPMDHPTLRPHALELALAKNGTGGPLRVDSISAWIDGPDTPIAEARGHEVPDLVFPNYGDHAYAKVSLDEASVDFIRTNLDKVEDALLRELLWMSLWEMVRDRELRSTEYLSIGRSELPDEPDMDIVNTVLDRSAILINRYLPESSRVADSHIWFEAALDNAAQATGDRQIMWARSAINAAATPADVQLLVDRLGDSSSPRVFADDQDMRWAIAAKAIAYGLNGAETSRPTADAKEEAWRRINGEGFGSFHLTRAAMLGFFWPNQRDLLEPFVGRFFDSLRGVFETRDHPFARAYLVYLYPLYLADPQVLERSRQLLGSFHEELPTLSRQLAEVADELDRQIQIRNFAEASS